MGTHEVGSMLKNLLRYFGAFLNEQNIQKVYWFCKNPGSNPGRRTKDGIFLTDLLDKDE